MKVREVLKILNKDGWIVKRKQRLTYPAHTPGKTGKGNNTEPPW